MGGRGGAFWVSTCLCSGYEPHHSCLQTGNQKRGMGPKKLLSAAECLNELGENGGEEEETLCGER